MVFATECAAPGHGAHAQQEQQPAKRRQCRNAWQACGIANLHARSDVDVGLQRLGLRPQNDLHRLTIRRDQLQRMAWTALQGQGAVNRDRGARSQHKSLAGGTGQGQVVEDGLASDGDAACATAVIECHRAAACLKAATVGPAVAHTQGALSGIERTPLPNIDLPGGGDLGVAHVERALHVQLTA